MHSAARAFAVFSIFAIISAAWLVLGGVMSSRTASQSRATAERVSDLWGSPQTQEPPDCVFVSEAEAAKVSPGDKPADGVHLGPSATRIQVDLGLDQRLKGLTWYSLYDVAFDGAWTYENKTTQRGALRLSFALPNPNAVYDAFQLTVDGVDVAAAPTGGVFTTEVPVAAGQVVHIASGYKSRGLDEWRYARRESAAPLKDFSLVMTTNFREVDFPSMTLSPSTKTATGAGYELTWRFEQLVSGLGIGMAMPKRIQPGELASSLSFSAPISLFFFFLIVAVLAKLRNLDIHPINYFFLGAAFFSFHLLFSYSVDHLPLLLAFGLSSFASLVMVVSYLRLVVSARFAYREAAAAQLVYLVGFSLAHFLDGLTGITLTVLSVMTLFLLMMLTGRIRWSEVLRTNRDQGRRDGAEMPAPGATWAVRPEQDPSAT